MVVEVACAATPVAVDEHAGAVEPKVAAQVTTHRNQRCCLPGRPDEAVVGQLEDLQHTEQSLRAGLGVRLHNPHPLGGAGARRRGDVLAVALVGHHGDRAEVDVVGHPFDPAEERGEGCWVAHQHGGLEAFGHQFGAAGSADGEGVADGGAGGPGRGRSGIAVKHKVDVEFGVASVAGGAQFARGEVAGDDQAALNEGAARDALVGASECYRLHTTGPGLGECENAGGWVREKDLDVVVGTGRGETGEGTAREGDAAHGGGDVAHGDNVEGATLHGVAHHGAGGERNCGHIQHTTPVVYQGSASPRASATCTQTGAGRGGCREAEVT